MNIRIFDQAGPAPWNHALGSSKRACNTPHEHSLRVTYEPSDLAVRAAIVVNMRRPEGNLTSPRLKVPLHRLPPIGELCIAVELRIDVHGRDDGLPLPSDEQVVGART